jgi:DNA-binding beta-propeller fold protein YncE
VVGSGDDLEYVSMTGKWLRSGGLVAETIEIVSAPVMVSEPGLRAIILLIPAKSDPELTQVLRFMKSAVRSGLSVIAIVRKGYQLPTNVGHPKKVLRLGIDPTELRSNLLGAVLDQRLFRCQVVPGVTSPTGIASWTSSQVIVSCDDTGRVSSFDAASGRSISLLVGLVEPHGVAVDRRTILIASKGSNTVLTGELTDGRFSPRREIGLRGVPRLSSPHYATQLGGKVLIVDSDNHRILCARGQVLERLGRFETLPIDTELKHPCGAALFQEFVLIADTFNDRVLVVRDGRVERFAIVKMPAPVQIAVAPDGLILVTATDGLHLLRLATSGGEVSVVESSLVAAGGEHAMLAPFGVAVDRGGRVFVADRGRGVVWVAELRNILASEERHES